MRTRTRTRIESRNNRRGIGVDSTTTTTTTTATSQTNRTTTTTTVRIRPVQMPLDLPAIRACRRLAFTPSSSSSTTPPPALFNSQRNFINATAVATGQSQCLVAVPSSLVMDNRNNDEEEEEEETTCTTSCHNNITTTTTTIFGTVDFQYDSHLKTVWINNVFVAPPYRGQGIARQLLVGIEQHIAALIWMKHQQQQQQQQSPVIVVVVATLQVYTRNLPAMALYRSCGYRTNGLLHQTVEAFSNATGINLLIDMIKPFGVSPKNHNI